MDRRSPLFGVLTTALLCAVASRAHADGSDYHEDVEVRPSAPHLTLPIESGHAAAWEPDRAGPVYRWSGGVLPGVWYERFSAHALAQLHYRNPDWDAGVGARVTFRFLELVGGFVPVRGVLESAYLPVEDNTYVAAGAMFGVGSLVHVVLLPGWDIATERGFFGVRLGLDLLALRDPIGAMTAFVPHEDLPR